MAKTTLFTVPPAEAAARATLADSGLGKVSSAHAAPSTPAGPQAAGLVMLFNGMHVKIVFRRIPSGCLVCTWYAWGWRTSMKVSVG